jgi:mannose-6-phosphate isomerase-like protein (cupin superfamily)
MTSTPNSQRIIEHTVPPRQQVQDRQAIAFSMPQTGEHFLHLSSARSGDGVFRFRWTLAPGKKGPPPHMHPSETETFVVVSGALRVWAGGHQRDLGPGEAMSVPPGVAHRFLNPGPEPAIVEVSLDGHLQEDTLVPFAILQSGGVSIGTSAFIKNTIVQFANGAIGAHPPLANALLRGIARVLVALGVRTVPPVPCWDAPGFSLQQATVDLSRHL